MATCSPQELMDDAGCFACLDPQSLQTINTALLCNIAIHIGAMATCDPQTLIDSAKCFACLTPAQIQILQLQLLCEISSATGGGGGGGLNCCHYGLGSPEGVEVGNLGNTYVQTDAPGVIWVKVADNGLATGWAVNT